MICTGNYNTAKQQG